VNALADPRQAREFRFVACAYSAGAANLRYAFDDGPELVERIEFPEAPPLPPERAAAFAAALQLLHLIAGVSYYKAGVQAQLRVEGEPLDAATAEFLDAIYLHGLAEFAYQNKLDLRGCIRFPHGDGIPSPAAALHLARRAQCLHCVIVLLNRKIEHRHDGIADCLVEQSVVLPDCLGTLIIEGIER